MEIYLNGDKEVLNKEYTLLELITEYGFSPEMINISLNGSIVEKDSFQTTIIKDGDSIDILFFMGGGH